MQIKSNYKCDNSNKWKIKKNVSLSTLTIVVSSIIIGDHRYKHYTTIMGLMVKVILWRSDSIWHNESKDACIF